MVGEGLKISNTGVLAVNNTGAGNGGVTQLNKLLFTRSSTKDQTEIWLMNYDGTGQTRVNIPLTAGQELGDNPKMSPDGKKLFIVITETVSGGNKEDIYSCDPDGKNLKKLYDMPVSYGHSSVGGAY